MLDFDAGSFWSTIAAGLVLAGLSWAVGQFNSRAVPKIRSWASTTASANRKNLPKLMNISWSIASVLLPLWFMLGELGELLADPSPLTRGDAFLIAFWLWWTLVLLMTVAFPHMFGLKRAR